MTLISDLSAAPYDPELPFLKEEYEGRIRAVRRQMSHRGLDALIVSNVSNLTYLTGYNSAFPSGYAIGLLLHEGGITLHCSEIDAVCALQSSTIRDVVTFEWHDAVDTATGLAKMLLDKGLNGRRLGIEKTNVETFTAGALDAASLERLTGMLDAARFRDASDLILNVRRVKSDREIEYMKRAARYTQAGVTAGIDSIGPGNSDNDCAAAIQNAVTRSGSEAMSAGPLVISGERTGWMPHVPFRRNAMAAGDPVFFELSGVHNRYHAPAMRTVAVSHASPELQRIADIAIGTVHLTLDHLRPGRSGDDVWQASGALLSKSPDIYFFGSYGYSIGLGQAPSWTEAPLYLAEGEETELESGMCFHVATCIFIPRRIGVGFSQSVALTGGSYELLNPDSDLELLVG